MIRPLTAALVWLAMALLPAPLLAQTSGPVAPLKIGTRVVSPFVMRDEGGKLTGFSIDLWTAIARDMKVQYDFVVAPDLSTLLSDVAAGRSDLAIAAISITAERERSFDFSQPMFDGGLQIAVAQGPAADPDPITAFLSFVWSKAFLEILAAICVLMLLPAPFIWLLERNSGEELLDAKTSLGQFGQAVWWSVCALVGQAQDMPSRLVGRLIAVPWIMFAVLFASYFTAAVATRMTVKQLERGIDGPADLPGHKVVSVAGSSAAAWLRARNISAKETADIEKALDAVESGDAQAVVYDEPVLGYHASHGRKGRLRLTGPVFQPEHYGVMFQPGAPQRRVIDEALLRLKENGEYQRIRQKWFASAGE